MVEATGKPGGIQQSIVKRPEFSVIIPSKTIENLVLCIEAIYMQEPHLEPSDIVVVDDGLELDRESAAFLAGVNLLPGIKPFVFARNVNTGIRSTFPKVEVTCMGDAVERFIEGPPERGIIILNDDALLETQNGFSTLARAAEEYPEYGLIASACNNVGNPNQFRRGAGLREEPRMVCFVCVFIPASTLGTVGLLDERYVDYGMDDDDYSFQVRQSGLRIGIHDGCFVDHASLKSSYRGDPTTPADFHPNLARFREKWGCDNWGRV